MRNRITDAQLALRTEHVSEMLRDLFVATQDRNGYTGLDLYDARGCIRTLTTGTKREVYEYLGAMEEALYIVGRD
jgi:hypothetical protein